MLSNDRFKNHCDSPLLAKAGAQSVATNYDFLAEIDKELAMAYLVRTVGTRENPVNVTGLVTLLGNSPNIVNQYGTAGGANAPLFTVDPDGVTLRVGKPRANWLQKLATDPRPKHTLPAVDLTRKR